MRQSKNKVIFWALMCAGALLLLSQAGYSDGDDAFFYQYSHEMGFFEYLGWRYQTWVGRMAAEALVYMTFHFGLWFWRVVNALMLVLIPIGIIKLAQKAGGMTGEGLPELFVSVAGVSGYLLMGAMTIGYAAVWVNGSIFYTWTFACGIWAMIPLADFVFDTGRFSIKQLLFSIPCAVTASMSIEQMGAVLLAFEVIGLVIVYWKRRAINPGLIMQTILTLAAFLVLFSAPGNDIRVASEVVNWMPQYDLLTVGEHLFITVQWLLSSFANENRLFLCGIWIVGMMLILQKNRRTGVDNLLVLIAAVLTVIALLPYAGITFFSDMGMGVMDITRCIERVPQISDLTAQNYVALIWWGAALIGTVCYLWYISKFQITVLLAYLGGIASEAILFFSPTMYASGARVYYLTDLMYLFIMITLSLKLTKKNWSRNYYLLLFVMGIINFVVQIPVFANAW